MSDQNISGVDHSSHPERTPNEMHPLFSDMEQAGLDVNILLEVAAHDLINQFGDKALDYSLQIEQDFLMANDLNSMLIWKKISNYLLSLNGNGRLVAH